MEKHPLGPYFTILTSCGPLEPPEGAPLRPNKRRKQMFFIMLLGAWGTGISHILFVFCYINAFMLLALCAVPCNVLHIRGALISG